MFILHFLPDTFVLWFCNMLLLTGVVLTVAGFFVHRIPVISQYQLLFRVLGIVLLTLCVYLRGGVAVEQEWRERVAAVETRLAQAEKASTESNVKIEQKSQKKTTEIRQRTQYIRQYVDREVVKYDAGCEIPPAFVRAHNNAAEAPVK